MPDCAQPESDHAARTRISWWRAICVVLLSLMWPGLGQIHAGAYRSGLWLLLLNTIVVFVFFWAFRVHIATMTQFLALAGFAVLSLIFALFVTIHAVLCVLRLPATRRPWYRSAWVMLPLTLIVCIGLSAWRGKQQTTAFLAAAPSMEPAIMVNDRVLGNKTYAATGNFERGDVIAFHNPVRRASLYIKRIVGLPGDRVQMNDGKLFLNGTELPSQYMGQFRAIADPTAAPLAFYRLTLPGGRRFDVGKTQEDAPLDRTPIFLVPPDYVFVIGDNLDNSLDSRDSLGMGMIPRANIEALIDFVLWSPDKNRIGLPIR
jgi:signal peptidase I